MYEIIDFAEIILKLPIRNNIAIPDLFISDEIVTKTYKIYDYDYILKLINSFLEKHPFSKFSPILANIQDIIRYREESNSIKELPNFVEELEEIINKSEPSAERNAVKKIASNLKNPKSYDNILLQELILWCLLCLNFLLQFGSTPLMVYWHQLQS